MRTTNGDLIPNRDPKGTRTLHDLAGVPCRANPRSLVAALAVIAFAGWTGGCGTNFGDILGQAGAAAGRTALDAALTDLANSVADTTLGTTPSDTGGSSTSGGTEEGSMPESSGPADFSGLTGDATAGQALFTSNGCIACHCDDASGGCALDAPRIAGVAPTRVDEKLRGTEFHPIKVDLTDQDVVDIGAFLASLAP